MKASEPDVIGTINYIRKVTPLDALNDPRMDNNNKKRIKNFIDNSIVSTHKDFDNLDLQFNNWNFNLKSKLFVLSDENNHFKFKNYFDAHKNNHLKKHENRYYLPSQNYDVNDINGIMNDPLYSNSFWINRFNFMNFIKDVTKKNTIHISSLEDNVLEDYNKSLEVEYQHWFPLNMDFLVGFFKNGSSNSYKIIEKVDVIESSKGERLGPDGTKLYIDNYENKLETMVEKAEKISSK